MRGLGVEPLAQLLEDGGQGAQGDLSLVLGEHLEKPAHVGALVMVGQVHSHVHRGDGVLSGLIAIPDAQGEAQAANAHAVDGKLAVVAFALGVNEGGHGREGWETKIPLPQKQQWDQDGESTPSRIRAGD